MAKYQSTKTYGHDIGLSCAFRQWRATHSHCSKLHGYALAFRFVFEADKLDSRNWVVDFGGLKELKQRLQWWFDHTVVIAGDDPLRAHFEGLQRSGAITLRVMNKGVGCEMFAEFAYDMATHWLITQTEDLQKHVKLVSCEVSEHGANSAIYYGE